MMLVDESVRTLHSGIEGVLGFSPVELPARSNKVLRLALWTVQWALVVVAMTYVGAAFQLFQLDKTVVVYGQLGWFAHIAAVAALVVGTVLGLAAPKKKKGDKGAAAASSQSSVGEPSERPSRAPRK